NTLAGRDLLKRGAGIITAFITRLRTNGDVGGWVELKPWSQVMEELNTTLRLLPVFQEESEAGDPLDIRRPQDRELLQSWLEKMRVEWQQTRGRLDTNFILLSGFLEGYAAVSGAVGDTVNRLIFDAGSIERHRQYVGREGQAVYVRDMELHYPIPWLGDEVEIADCQGIDSPNPAHFGLLQQYLLESHFILFVISSRTGLRESDFKLLDFIKTLRMFPQTYFILNVDLDSHPHREDLDALVERVRTELGWVVPDPQLFTFSTLYHLVGQLGDRLPEREAQRLELWKADQALSRATEEGFSAFMEHLGKKIVQQRSRVLLGSGLCRLGTVAGSVMDSALARKKFMVESLENQKRTAEKLKSRQKALQATLGTLENAIAGLQDALKREMSDSTDRFFALNGGPIVQETLSMVDSYPIGAEYRKELGDWKQLLRQLYRFYLEFRQTLSRYVMEKVNLRVIEFAKEQEEVLTERLDQSSRAFWALFSAALDDYRREFSELKVERRAVEEQGIRDGMLGDSVIPPAFSAFMGQEVVSHGVFLMKFGIGRFTRFLAGVKSRMGKEKLLLDREAQQDESFDEAIALVKSETRSELLAAFREYRNSFKYAYAYRMAEETTVKLAEEFKAVAGMAQVNFANLLDRSDTEGADSLPVLDILARAGRVTGDMVEELDGLRCAVTLE
ncbi:MAG: dynamin family protein, partial [Desulfobacteraceae bacterium]|nr:dynamin family protein [Desulfobacteraceae bacterium]